MSKELGEMRELPWVDGALGRGNSRQQGGEGGRVAERARWGSDEVDSDEGLDGFPLRLEALRILIRHPLQKDPRVAEEGWTWSFQVGGH